MGLLDAPGVGRKQVPSLMKMADLPGPVIIPHKGGVNVWPEHTVEAYDLAVAHGFQVLDLDARTLLDGGLANIHDPTVDALTTGAGSVNALTSPAFRQLAADVSTWTANSVGSGWPNGHVDLIGFLLARYGAAQIPQIESKSSNAAEVSKLVALLQQMNLQKRAVLSANNLTALAPSVAAGIETHYISTGSDLAGPLAAGITDLVMDAGAVSDATVQAAIAAGYRVWLYDVVRRYDRDRYTAMGVRGFYSGDPVYFRANAPLHSTDTFASLMYSHGHLLGQSSRGTLIAGGRLQFTAGQNQWALMGWACPILATSYTITATITLDAIGVNGSAFAGIHFCETDDRAYTNNASGWRTGYRFQTQQNGFVALVRTETDGSTTTLASVGITAPVNGEAHVAVITVTPTTITVTFSGRTLTTTDTTYRGPYFHLGQTGVTSLQSSFSAVTAA